MNEKVAVIGAGLAGSEAAYYLASRGVKVRLHEMKLGRGMLEPPKFSPAHKIQGFAELVCSNSLKNYSPDTASGLLKAEMNMLASDAALCTFSPDDLTCRNGISDRINDLPRGSLILYAAKKASVPAGGALAVDREVFSAYITKVLTEHPNIEIVGGEVCEIPEDNAIIATGPLTSDIFAKKIKERLEQILSDNNNGCFGENENISNYVNFEKSLENPQIILNFHDASSPVISSESIDFEKVFFAARYGKGDADYINCPFTKEEYESFYTALIEAETAPLHDFDRPAASDYSGNGKLKVYEGCMPVEVLAKRGFDSLRFGCMKPVGINYPEFYRGRKTLHPFAVVQLRAENAGQSLYNIVGFQTNLKFPEQKRVFSMIPGLEHAEFMRYGVMHRNTYINSPIFLDSFFRLKRTEKNIYFSGQLTGTEGYVESAASGLIASFAMYRRLKGIVIPPIPESCMLGALSTYVSDCSSKYIRKDFQPMGANMGILPELPVRIKDKKKKYVAYSERALSELKNYILKLQN